MIRLGFRFYRIDIVNFLNKFIAISFFFNGSLESFVNFEFISLKIKSKIINVTGY